MCSEHVSVDMNAQRMHLMRVAEHLGASSRRPRHPFPALMAGVSPGRGPVYTALKRHLEQEVVVVVQTVELCACLSRSHSMMELIGVAEHLRVRLPASLPPRALDNQQLAIEG